jgi:CDP-glucose 4,6-dehydratase
VETFSARFGGRPGWRRDEGVHPKEASALTLSSGLARDSLGWRPRLSVGDSLAWTADWYRAQEAKEDMERYTRAQIADYESLPAMTT